MNIPRVRKFRRPKVLFSKAGHGYHPHIVLGERDGKYLSVNITHQPSIKFEDEKYRPNKKLRNNPEVSYMVTGEYYFRDKALYRPFPNRHFSVSKETKDEAWKVVKKAKIVRD